MAEAKAEFPTSFTCKIIKDLQLQLQQLFSDLDLKAEEVRLFQNPFEADVASHPNKLNLEVTELQANDLLRDKFKEGLLQGATGRINAPLQVQSLDDADSEPSPANGAVGKLPPRTSMQGDTKLTIAGAGFGEDGNRITRRDNLSLFLTTHLSSSTSSINSVGGSSSPRTLSASSDSAMDKKSSRKQARDASPEISRGAPRLVNFFKRKIQAKRGKKETAVKEIYISPEVNDKWASRSGNNSRTSSGSTTYSNPRESSPNLLVVHDMNSEYNPEYS
ncbi:unnamed protein product [Lymnaea stagnalis]|uniref:Uncharacterized protein n=1 Tax=Lymnaea stagnalis TaxID=6523 RepID=A0AAV2HW35_LYMST